MSDHGGKRSGAGRSQGRRNRRTQAQIEAVEQGGITPLGYLMSVVQDTQAERAERLMAARIAAPYVQAR